MVSFKKRTRPQFILSYNQLKINNLYCVSGRAQSKPHIFIDIQNLSTATNETNPYFLVILQTLL